MQRLYGFPIAVFIVFCLIMNKGQGFTPVELKYAVQVEPVVFLIEPKSQMLNEGDPLLLSCQARVSALTRGDIDLPTLGWQKDGLPLEKETSNITDNSLTGHSKLVIQETNTNLSGSYRCIASDAGGRYITVSNEAIIEIIPKDTVYITAQVGLPLFLSCGSVSLLRMYTSTVSWTHNNNDPSHMQILSSGSLFIPSIHPNDHIGIWHCTTSSYKYNITTSLKADNDELQLVPTAIIDTLTTTNSRRNRSISNIATIGSTVHLYCQIVGIEDEMDSVESLTWYLIRANQTIVLRELLAEDIASINYYNISLFNETNSGQYYCSFGVFKDNVTHNVSTEGLDLLLNGYQMEFYPIVEDVFLEYTINSFVLDCGNQPHSNVPFHIHWMLNGKVLSAEYQTKGTLTVTKEMVDNDLFGMYQCFIKSNYDVRYSVHRVLVKYLSNPPGNMKIASHTNTSSLYHPPYLALSWTPPTMRGYSDILSYSIVVTTFTSEITATKFIQSSNAADTNSTTLPLQHDSIYIVKLSIYRPSGVHGMDTTCIVNTLDRFYTRTQSFDQVMCSDNGEVHVKWSPLGTNPDIWPTQDVSITGTCISSGHIFKFQTQFDHLYEQYQGQPFTGLVPGTLCEFYGKYKHVVQPPKTACEGDEMLGYDDLQTFHEIPRKTCQIQKDLAIDIVEIDSIAVLSLLCGFNEVRIFWSMAEQIMCNREMNDTLLILISGVCVYKDDFQMLNHSINLFKEPIGSVTFGNVSTNSICSFENSSTAHIFGLITLPSAQCIVDGSESDSSSALERKIQEALTSPLNNCTKNESSIKNATSSTTRVLDQINTGRSLSSILLDDHLETTATLEVSETAISSSVKPDSNTTVIVVLCFVSFILIASLISIFVIIVLRKCPASSKRKSWNLSEVEVKNENQLDTFDDACSIKTEIESFNNHRTFHLADKLDIYKGYTIEDRPDTTGSSGYGSETGTTTHPQCMADDYHRKKLREVDDENVCADSIGSATSSITISCGDGSNSLSGSSSRSTTDQHILGSTALQTFLDKAAGKEDDGGTVYHCERNYSGSLKRLYSREGQQEYIRLTALVNSKQIPSTDMDCSCCDDRSASATRLSALSL